MPEHGRSRIFEFSLIEDNQFRCEEMMVVPSIEAKDGSFFVADQSLHLVIAHRGNYTLDTKMSESLHLRLESSAESKAGKASFVFVQGYQGEIKES